MCDSRNKALVVIESCSRSAATCIDWNSNDKFYDKFYKWWARVSETCRILHAAWVGSTVPVRVSLIRTRYNIGKMESNDSVHRKYIGVLLDIRTFLNTSFHVFKNWRSSQSVHGRALSTVGISTIWNPTVISRRTRSIWSTGRDDGHRVHVKRGSPQNYRLAEWPIRRIFLHVPSLRLASRFMFGPKIDKKWN